MLANQVQPHYYYYDNGLTPRGSQAIRIHVYPAKSYKSKHACLLNILVLLAVTLVLVFSFSSFNYLGLVSSQINSKSIVYEVKLSRFSLEQNSGCRCRQAFIHHCGHHQV